VVNGQRDAVLRASHIAVEYGGAVPTRAVRDVSIELYRGEMLGIAGESGCGKSTLAYALTRLLRPPAVMTEGQVLFCGRDGGSPIDIMKLEPEALRRFRWTQISMVFQSAMNSLNPVVSLRRQFSDIFEAHVPEMERPARDQRSRELLEMVGIDPARLSAFPHELSGGMRQRVGIAMALALQPEVVIMDEPTTALDVVVQREILLEIASLRRELGFSVIFITHDLPMLMDLSDRLAVMYAGEIVERAPAERVGGRPAHPYTLGLQAACPDLLGERRALQGIPGSPPDLREELRGCAFAPRCRYVFGPCVGAHPVLSPLAPPVAFPHPGGDLHGGATRDGALVSPSVDARTGPGASKASKLDDWAVACHLHDRAVNPAGPPAELAGDLLDSCGKVLPPPPVDLGASPAGPPRQERDQT
jgi:peptide/nickel transport system ATP-binding protein